MSNQEWAGIENKKVRMFGALGIVTTHTSLVCSSVITTPLVFGAKIFPRQPGLTSHRAISGSPCDCTRKSWLGKIKLPRKAAGVLATAKQLANVNVIVSETETRRMYGVVIGSKKERCG